MAAPWEALISTAGGAAATVLGILVGTLVGRRSEERKWIRDRKVAAYERFLQSFTAVEMGMRDAYWEEREPEGVDWEEWNAALVSVSLVADSGTGARALELSLIIGEFSAFPFGEPKDMELLRQILQRLDAAQRQFVHAARRSLHPAEKQPVPWRLGGPPPWSELELMHQRDNELGRIIPG
ncbi:hypothetical protein ABH931_002701 [Streptacidiphilus sp. MAP12-33]|uniref:hypothetical protein n=1 Tax=Streptacidiphilus sp. MAP12-33 TaxID=3156266 RepID=UPI00351438C0